MSADATSHKKKGGVGTTARTVRPNSYPPVHPFIPNHKGYDGGMNIDSVIESFEQYREESDPSMAISDAQSEWFKEFLHSVADRYPDAEER